MKLILIASLFFSAHAVAKGQVFCKENGKIINVIDADTAYECQGALYTGEVCFTGDAAEAADVLNSGFIDEAFDGTDGEGIRNARVKTKNTIGYTRYDLKNEVSSKVEITRCTGAWFRN